MTEYHILVVEDDPALLDLLNQKLTSEGFALILASTGQQALDYLEQQRLDLVLLDILLPDIDGITILQEIAHRDTTKHLPVIIFSNLDDEGSFKQVAAIGSYTYLVKAKTELKDLVTVIRRKLGGES